MTGAEKTLTEETDIDAEELPVPDSTVDEFNRGVTDLDEAKKDDEVTKDKKVPLVPLTIFTARHRSIQPFNRVQCNLLWMSLTVTQCKCLAVHLGGNSQSLSLYLSKQISHHTHKGSENSSVHMALNIHGVCVELM